MRAFPEAAQQPWKDQYIERERMRSAAS